MSEASADMELLKGLNAKTYKAQAVWFLNAYWKTGPAFEDNADQAEKIWTFC
ncbi:TolA-like protein, putative, partial [Hondaea fermentalgiana]